VTEFDDDSLSATFWRKIIGFVLLGGLVAMIVFGLIGAAWYEWGIVGMFVFFGGILLLIAWIADRRKQKEYEEDQEIARSLDR